MQKSKIDHEYIIYVGDSFGAAMNLADYQYNGSQRSQRAGTSDDPYQTACHPSLVAQHFGLRLLNFCYAGKSWWYSRAKLFESLEKYENLLARTFALVFIHTGWDRLNNKVHSTASHAGKSPGIFDPGRQVLKAQQYHMKYLYDEDFQYWCGQNWLREIDRMFSHIPTLHFFSFGDSIFNNPIEQSHLSLLPGRKFTTPLVQLSVAEMSGSDQEILDYITTDPRANHFNQANNVALAKITISALEQYEPGDTAIDHSIFSITNPNGLSFPNPGFGTR